MQSGQSFSPSRTLPLKGFQHITAPALPTAALESEHLPQLPYHPILNREIKNNSHIYSLSATLREIGPSARLLINSHNNSNNNNNNKSGVMGKGNKTGKGRNKNNMGNSYIPTCGRSIESKRNEIYSNKILTNTNTVSLEDSNNEEMKNNSPTLGVLKSPRSVKDLAAKAVDLNKTLNQTYSGTRDSLNKTFCRTISKKTIPPLAIALENYIQREMNSTLENLGIVTAHDRLRPFREAFFTFIDAFPVYGKILNDIMTAYDGVIQEQAQILDQIITERSNQQFGEEEYRQKIGELNSMVAELTTELDEARGIVDDKEFILESTKDGNILQRPLSRRAMKNSSDKDKKLNAAKEKIKALEEINKGDLEKLLVLVNAVRESDKRAKALETKLASFSAQAEELDDFKVMAGEAQKQLEEFKRKYQNFISVQDHELIREHLTEELQAAQNTARQYRRSAAVRGTQVDVIGRKLKVLQEENEHLLQVIEEERRGLLTPRPNWNKIRSSLPELEDIASPIKALPLEGDEAITSTVSGMGETALQVEYLVERINSLSNELERRSMIPLPIKIPKLPLIGQGVNSNIPLHLRACGIIPRHKLDSIEVVILVHDFFHDVLQEHPDVLLHTLDVPSLYMNFLREIIGTRESLRSFVCAEHLAINLADMAKDEEHCRPSLLLLNGILSGIYPARIACDVMMIIDNVRSELKGLAEAQRKTRLRRTAINDCILPVLQLKSTEEIISLREALGSDTTHDVTALNSTGGKFMSTLLDQECASGIMFYVNLIEKLTSYAYYLENNGGDLVITLENVGKAILEVEPLTPKPIIKEITEKSTDSSQKEGEEITRLSEVIHVLAAAPLIRRTAQRKAEEGIL